MSQGGCETRLSVRYPVFCLASRFKGYFRVSLLFAMKNLFAFKKVGVFFGAWGSGGGGEGREGCGRLLSRFYCHISNNYLDLNVIIVTATGKASFVSSHSTCSRSCSNSCDCSSNIFSYRKIDTCHYQ